MNLRLPYAGEVYISSAYGYRTDPITGETGVFHGGLDLIGRESKTLLAPCDGVIGMSTIVTDISNRTWEWGNYIRIDTDNGYNVYLCHLAERYVQAGDRVSVGQAIALEGSTGKSTGPHCHFEVRKNGEQINPCTFLGILNLDDSAVRNEVIDMTDETTNAGHEWAAEAVQWARDNGIIYGDENGNLMLDKPCTREQMIVFLYRLYKLLGGA